MITYADISIIDGGYFDIIEAREYFIVLRSKTTGHYWYLLEQEANGHRTFQIKHRHNKTAPYHPQKNKANIAACCEYIKEHDAFHLERVKRQKQKRLDRLSIGAPDNDLRTLS